ncbi:MAG: Hpt domain-containing protein [Pseudomonadota bacterium]
MGVLLQERSTTGTAIDRVHLAAYTMSDPELEQEILGLFRDSLRDLLLQLQGAVGCPDPWMRLTHTIKGSARGVGAFALGDAAAAAERDTSGDAPCQRAHIVTLRACADDVFYEIDQLTAPGL